MKDFIIPFDIVSTQYVDLNGQVKTFDNGVPQKALFMVLAVDNCNVTACKLTSHSSSYTNNDYSYLLMLESHPFLVSESFVQCDKIHTFDVRSCTKVGSVAVRCRLGVVEKVTKFFGHLRLTMDYNCPKYTSPNAHLHTPYRGRFSEHNSDHSSYNGGFNDEK